MMPTLTMARSNAICLSCGTASSGDGERCTGCGARLVSLGDDTRPGADRSAFAIAWFAASLVAYSLALAVVIVGLPFVIRTYDPQGLAGILIGLAIWFVGGIVVGSATRDRRYLEPTAAAALTAAAIIPYIAFISDVRALSPASYVAGGFLGVLAAFMGAFAGDRLAPQVRS